MELPSTLAGVLKIVLAEELSSLYSITKVPTPEQLIMTRGMTDDLLLCKLNKTAGLSLLLIVYGEAIRLLPCRE